MAESFPLIHLLSSDEPLLKKDLADELLAKARTLLPDAQYLIFTLDDFKSTGADAKLSALENELRDPGLFGGDRILKFYLRDYDQTAAQVLSTLARFFRPGIFAIIDLPRLNASFKKLAPKAPSDKPPKRNELKNSAIANLKYLGAQLNIIYPPSGADLVNFIAQRCRKAGFSIDRPTAALLASLNEGNLTAIDQALQLMALNAKQGAITQDDLDTYFVEDSRFSAFEFTEALISGQGSRALNILHAVMAASGGGAATNVPLIISRLDTCLNVIVKIKDEKLQDDRTLQALLLKNGIVTPALKSACLQAARLMPLATLNFLILNLKECALLHAHFKLDAAAALLQTMAVAVNVPGAMVYGQA